MNKYFAKSFYTLFIILVFSCNHDKNLKQNEKESSSNDCINIERYYNEYLSLDSMIINSRILPIASKLEVEKVFGKPIKVEYLDRPTDLTFLIDEKQSDIKRYYFKNAIFESNQGKLVLSSINFINNNNVIKHPLIILNNKTTGLDLFKPFPEHLKSKTFHKRGCNICSFVINIKESKSRDGFWSLVFLADTLSRLEFHTFSFDRQIQ